MGGLDQLVKTYVTKAMQGAGFEKAGRVFRAVGESGDHAFIWYSERKSQQPGATTFTVTASLMITTYREFLNRNEHDADPIMPNFLLNTLAIEVEPPSNVALRPEAEHHHQRQYWTFEARTRGVCGATLATLLVDDLAPWLLARLDRAALVGEIEHPTRSWRGAPYGTTTQTVLALLDHAPLSEIDRLVPAIQDVTPDGSLTAWITARLDKRRRELTG